MQFQRHVLPPHGCDIIGNITTPACNLRVTLPPYNSVAASAWCPHGVPTLLVKHDSLNDIVKAQQRDSDLKVIIDAFKTPEVKLTFDSVPAWSTTRKASWSRSDKLQLKS